MREVARSEGVRVFFLFILVWTGGFGLATILLAPTDQTAAWITGLIAVLGPMLLGSTVMRWIDDWNRARHYENEESRRRSER